MSGEHPNRMTPLLFGAFGTLVENIPIVIRIQVRHDLRLPPTARWSPFLRLPRRATCWQVPPKRWNQLHLPRRKRGHLTSVRGTGLRASPASGPPALGLERDVKAAVGYLDSRDRHGRIRRGCESVTMTFRFTLCDRARSWRSIA